MEIHRLESWPRPFTKFRRRAAFKATYSKTIDLLERELAKIGARNVVLSIAYRAGDLRLDGIPRANAWPEHPGVILSFERKTGSVQMPCDTFDNWQDNIRAIALSLESLRTVDRYGVTKNGEQYAGWTRLGEGDSAMFKSKEAAESFLNRLLGESIGTMPRDRVRRECEKKSHPDTGGSGEMFKATRNALEFLGY